MSDAVSLTLGRIENEISRHKAAHESHLHWAIILFAANIAVFIRNGFSVDLWPLPAIGLLLNLALWCRAARAYNALARHWDSRDKVYRVLLKGKSYVVVRVRHSLAIGNGRWIPQRRGCRIFCQTKRSVKMQRIRRYTRSSVELSCPS